MHVPMALVVCLTVTQAVAGCRDETSAVASSPSFAEAEPAKTAAATAQRCDRDFGKVLRAEMMSYCDAGEAVGPVGMAQLPWPATGTKPAESLLIELRSLGPHIDGTPVALRDLAQAFKRQLQLTEALAKTPGPWSLAIAGEAPMEQVVAVTDALAAAGQLDGRLVFTTKIQGTLVKPRNPKRLAEIHRRVHATEPSAKAMRLAKEVEESLPTCGGLLKAFGAVAAAAPSMKCKLLAHGASEGLIDCGCRDLDLTMTILYAIMAGTTVPTTRAAYVVVRLNPAATPTVAKKGTPWSSFLATLDHSALAGLKLVVR